MKKIIVLGSTGVIGRKTLDIIREFPKAFKVVGLTANNNQNLLEKQILEFKPEVAGIVNGKSRKIKNLTQIYTGKECLNKVVAHDADMVVVAVVGLSGLLPTLKSIQTKKNIALASKEVMVLAGNIITKEAKKYNINLIPIDSELSAIHQILNNDKKAKIVNRLILTMGKGPLSMLSNFENVTINQVFNRRQWAMGRKIAIDSATCVNKSFEVIEAKWFFNISSKKIDVIVHPEYLCHSMVELIDGSIIAQIGIPDMKYFIKYALFYPERKRVDSLQRLSLIDKKISFQAPPYEKFPCLKLGYTCLKKGGSLAAVMHGADDVAVQAFLNKKISFSQIHDLIDKTIKEHKVSQANSIKAVIKAHNWGRKTALSILSSI